MERARRLTRRDLHLTGFRSEVSDATRHPHELETGVVLIAVNLQIAPQGRVGEVFHIKAEGFKQLA